MWFNIFFGFSWRTTTLKWWICTGKNSLHASRVQESTSFVRWMFEIYYFIYAIFPWSDYYWILFRPPIAHYKRPPSKICLSSTHFLYSSRPNLICFGFDLNQWQRKIPLSRNGYLPDRLPHCLFLPLKQGNKTSQEVFSPLQYPRWIISAREDYHLSLPWEIITP